MLFRKGALDEVSNGTGDSYRDADVSLAAPEEVFGHERSYPEYAKVDWSGSGHIPIHMASPSTPRTD